MGEMTFLCLPDFFFGYPRNVKVAGGYEGHPRRFPLCGSTFIMLFLLKVVVCAALFANPSSETLRPYLLNINCPKK